MYGGQASQSSCMRPLRKRRTGWYFLMRHLPVILHVGQIVVCRFSKQIGQIEETLYKKYRHHLDRNLQLMNFSDRYGQCVLHEVQ